MYECLLIAFVVVMFALGVTVALYFARRRTLESPNHEEVLREAAELRERASDLNTGSGEIEARARRLEQLLKVHRRDGS